MKLTVQQPSLFAFRLDEQIANVLTDTPQTVEQIAAQINALVVETNAALALMALEGRVRLGMGFVYFAPARTDSNHEQISKSA